MKLNWFNFGKSNEQDSYACTLVLSMPLLLSILVPLAAHCFPSWRWISFIYFCLLFCSFFNLNILNPKFHNTTLCGFHSIRTMKQWDFYPPAFCWIWQTRKRQRRLFFGNHLRHNVAIWQEVALKMVAHLFSQNRVTFVSPLRQEKYFQLQWQPLEVRSGNKSNAA